MRVVIFLAYLCCFLLKWGDACMAAGPAIYYKGNSYTARQHKAKEYPLCFARSIQDYSVVEDTDTGAEREYLIDDDTTEDDDVTIADAGKYKPSARYPTLYQHLSPLYLFAFYYRCDYCKTPQSFFGQVSCKYIVQGALRI